MATKNAREPSTRLSRSKSQARLALVLAHCAQARWTALQRPHSQQDAPPIRPQRSRQAQQPPSLPPSAPPLLPQPSTRTKSQLLRSTTPCSSTVPPTTRRLRASPAIAWTEPSRSRRLARRTASSDLSPSRLARPTRQVTVAQTRRVRRPAGTSVRSARTRRLSRTPQKMQPTARAMQPTTAPSSHQRRRRASRPGPRPSRSTVTRVRCSFSRRGGARRRSRAALAR